MIRLQHPWWLLGLSLPLLAAWLSLRGGRSGSRSARAVAVLRAALLTAGVLALAGVEMRLPPRDFSVIFVVDRSLSVTQDEQSRAWRWVTQALEKQSEGDRAAVVTFGADAAVEADPQPKLRLPAPQGLVTREATDVAGALRLAHALLPADSAGRVVLLSDGLETDGDMLGEGERLAAAGVPVGVVPLSGEAASDLVVERLEAPQDAARGERFELRAEVFASTPTSATARLFRGEQLIAARPVKLDAGRSALRFDDALPQPGLARYSLYLDSPGDARPENNKASAAVEVKGPPQALIVEGASGHASGVARALAAAGIEARTVGISGYPRGLAEMAPYSAIVLDNVPAYALSPKSQAETRAYVGDLGGGLVMLGGDHSFAAGGYSGTPIEDALPVNMESKRPDLDLSLAIAVVIDRSGSMGMMTAGGVQKIQLAAEGAIKLVEMLRPEQSLGICAVDTAPDWIVPLAPLSAKGEAVETIGRLRAGGGGIYVYTGLESAWEKMKGLKAAVRHVILFSDAADAEEKDKNGRSALDLIAEMNKAGVTVSTIGLGRPTDVDAAWLEQAAQVGKGRYYLTNESENLPSIFIREGVLARRAAFIQEPFKPKLKRASDPVKGIGWSSAPLLRGYVLAEAKDAADVGLVSHRGDPILASWRYGLGRSVAFTSDAQGAWSKDWASWPGAGQLWAQALRWAAKPAPQDGLTVRTELRGREARVIVEAASPDGAPLNFLTLEGQALSPQLEREPLRFSQTGLGRYEAAMPVGDEGAYLMRVQAAGAGKPLDRVGSFIVPYPAEFQRHETDAARLSRLAELTGGRWKPAKDDVFRREPSPARRPVDLSRFFLTLAALLLPLDVAARRLRWRGESWRPVVDAAKSRLGKARDAVAAALPAGAPAAAAAASPDAGPAKPQTSWDRLKDAKKRARKKTGE